MMKKLFSLLALVGLFAACRPEKIPVAFEVDDAIAEIQVVATDVTTGEVTEEIEILHIEGATIENGTIFFKGDPTIKAMTVTVSVKYLGEGPGQGKVYSVKDVMIPDVSRGGKCVIKVHVAVNEPYIILDEPAELTINVKAFDVLTQAATTDFVIDEVVCDDETLTITTSGSNVLVKGSNKIELGAQIAVFVKFTGEGAGNGQIYTAVFTTPEMLPSTKATLPLNIIVNEPALDPQENAKVTITVTAIDIVNGSHVDGLTFSSSAGTVAGNVITIEGNPTISAQEVTISTVFEGKTYSDKIAVADMPAGMSQSFALTLLVNEVVPVNPGLSYSVEQDGDPISIPETAYFTASGAIDRGTSYDVDGYSHSIWAINENEYFLNVPVEYTIRSGSKASVFLESGMEKYKGVLDIYASAYEDNPEAYEGVKTSKTFKVSAYAWYTIWQTRIRSSVSYIVYATPTLDGVPSGERVKIGRITVEGISADIIQYAEMAPPSGAYSHSYAHGHGHGEETHAGGGIVFSE